MNLERLRWGDWIAAIAGLDLILVTFRGWYKVAGTDAYVTAWDALEQGRYLLLLTGFVGILLLLLKAQEAELSFPPGWLAAIVGFACTVYVAYRLATPPADTLDAAAGIYFGLVGALGVTIGGLLSARDDTAVAPAGASADIAPEIAEPSSGYSPPAAAETWSPAAPAATTSGWSPAAPAMPAATVPPATAAGAALGGEGSLRPGDAVVLTAGGARFPAGTVATVIEAFGGGALVEVKAPDGLGERFEVPDSAFEPAAAGGGAGSESWSPAMPAPANEDWGFDEPGAGPTGLSDENGASPEPAAPAEKKVPWWKREIGGGGKNKPEEAAGVGAVGAAAAGAAIAASDNDGESEQKPGFFKRMFGGGSKAEPETAALEGESPEATVDEAPGPEDVAGPSVIAADPSPTAVDPDPAPPATPEAAEAPDPVSAVDPEPAAAAESPAAEAAPEAEVPAPVPDPEPEPPAPEPVPEPEATAPEPEPPAPEPEPEPPAPELEAAAPEPEPPEPEAAAAEPEPAASEPASESGAGTAAAAAGAGAAAAGAAAAGAAAAGGDEEAAPEPKRTRSSGSRKVPKEAMAAAGAADEAPPKVGDEVQLKVDGGKFDAGTRGTVVDVFSAGVIVELSDDDGRTERLDLPFEAVGPADK